MKLWAVRNSEDILKLYRRKPSISKIAGRPVCTNGGFIGLTFNDLFPEITFENSPQEVEIKIVNNEKD